MPSRTLDSLVCRTCPTVSTLLHFASNTHPFALVRYASVLRCGHQHFRWRLMLVPLPPSSFLSPYSLLVALSNVSRSTCGRLCAVQSTCHLTKRRSTALVFPRRTHARMPPVARIWGKQKWTPPHTSPPRYLPAMEVLPDDQGAYCCSFVIYSGPCVYVGEACSLLSLCRIAQCPAAVSLWPWCGWPIFAL
ncbi:hypothetical protein B0H14DRAFT_2817361 [Mycena olivaceomarginata]|nr:hypothetical protein B0H14DRAFT_2817361 [Mycena olivaceomarginata]